MSPSTAQRAGVLPALEYGISPQVRTRTVPRCPSRVRARELSSRTSRRGLAWSMTQASSLAETGGGAARHTRAWSVGAPAVVADCRRLRFVPQPCQIQGAATVNAGAPRSSSRPLLGRRTRRSGMRSLSLSPKAVIWLAATFLCPPPVGGISATMCSALARWGNGSQAVPHVP